MPDIWSENAWYLAKRPDIAAAVYRGSRILNHGIGGHICNIDFVLKSGFENFINIWQPISRKLAGLIKWASKVEKRKYFFYSPFFCFENPLFAILPKKYLRLPKCLVETFKFQVFWIISLLLSIFQLYALSYPCLFSHLHKHTHTHTHTYTYTQKRENERVREAEIMGEIDREWKS